MHTTVFIGCILLDALSDELVKDASMTTDLTAAILVRGLALVHSEAA